MASSLDFVANGTPDEFVQALVNEVWEHPAVTHTYLKRLASGDLPNVPMAIKDYAYQYSFYNAWFTRYLDGVIQQLKDPKHVDMLMENLEEEEGIPGAEKLEDRPHVEIFADFKQRVGINSDYIANQTPSTTVMIWRDLFLHKCQSPRPGVGLGGIGLATEFIVPLVYPHFVHAIERHTNFDDKTSLFFRLHVECDGDHADQIIAVTREVAKTMEYREAIRFGVRSSLNLREAFWDSQLVRALQMPPAEKITKELLKPMAMSGAMAGCL